MSLYDDSNAMPGTPGSRNFLSAYRLNRRPKWYDIYLNFARIISLRSTCSRLQVGCIIASSDNNRILAIGYNGNYPGGPNICDSDEPGKCGCYHSEQNALIKLDYNDLTQKIMYVTASPCVMCAKGILLAGIKEVWYTDQYRDTSGIQLLQKNGVTVIQRSPDILFNVEMEED